MWRVTILVCLMTAVGACDSDEPVAIADPGGGATACGSAVCVPGDFCANPGASLCDFGCRDDSNCPPDQHCDVGTTGQVWACVAGPGNGGDTVGGDTTVADTTGGDTTGGDATGPVTLEAYCKVITDCFLPASSCQGGYDAASEACRACTVAEGCPAFSPQGPCAQQCGL